MEVQDPPPSPVGFTAKPGGFPLHGGGSVPEGRGCQQPARDRLGMVFPDPNGQGPVLVNNSPCRQ